MPGDKEQKVSIALAKALGKPVAAGGLSVRLGSSKLGRSLLAILLPVAFAPVSALAAGRYKPMRDRTRRH
jgi:hypothetical protein